MSDKQYTHHDDRTELEKALVSAKPWFEQNGTTLIYGLAAVIAVAAVVVYLQRQGPAAAPGAPEFMLANTPEDFRDVADEFPDSQIGVWARLKQADGLVGNGISNMFTDRETGLKELDQAEAAYNQLANRSDVSDDVSERVLIGLARIAETKCDGTEESVNAAINAWKALLNQFEDSIVKEYAESRIDRLAEESTRDFYVWFHAQNPSPDDPLQMPSDGPGTVPDIPLLPGMGTSSPESEDDSDATSESSGDEAVPSGVAPEESDSTEDASENESSENQSDASPDAESSDTSSEESSESSEASETDSAESSDSETTEDASSSEASSSEADDATSEQDEAQE